jgi:hypothetical protein
MAMNRRAAADGWADALLPFPSVYDGYCKDAAMLEAPRFPSIARWRADGSIDCNHYAREAERLHRQAVARALRFPLSVVRRAMAAFSHDARKRARRTPDS